jgi:hypothetical protein
MLIKYIWTSALTNFETWIDNQVIASVSQYDIINISEERFREIFDDNSWNWQQVWAVDFDTYNLSQWVIQQKQVVIATADVLTLNWTAVELIPAPWAWKAIIVDRITWTVDYWSAAYATNTTLEFRYWTATTKVSADITSLLTATADACVSVWWLEAQLVNAINDNVKVNVATWNPTAWNSDIKLNITYRIVSI